ncbi:MAG: alpha/beta hydrolase [Candidatus Eisenbacteria bacterium]|uniref:Alpha/beta hydrolase n=1 Tax=Eiseniibacteriota bacterium TaxID=2212470 RepID=A0A948RWP5_UNCEI|nr:alpha/beta hydrolase [Candidatus Eisenbacteria bacterium]MBU1950852.1 alpha/beta hydrolase [Candidatus Eisenbacteria bacterium]MBU2692418.1 alpha/beta hydrolase [Candidatus Eisenbacteria bacterium]
MVIVLHGGPGAPGYMAPVARGLEDSFRVIEPLQRRSGGEPLTVARHVDDLHEVITKAGKMYGPALVGSSWGAMLALAYAATYPAMAGPLVLIGCGTFDLDARAAMKATIDKRMDESLRIRLKRLPEEFPNPDDQLKSMGDLIQPLHIYKSLAAEPEGESCDARGHHETWDDMVRLQSEGVYPEAFAVIKSPVLMLHGTYDPHPGRMIQESLKPYITQLEYHEWERCGHYPWLETSVRGEFFNILNDWLKRNLPRDY